MFFKENFLGYQYLKLRASRYPSHSYGAGPSRSQAHGRPWFPIPIPQKVLCTWKDYQHTEGIVPIVLLFLFIVLDLLSLGSLSLFLLGQVLRQVQAGHVEQIRHGRNGLHQAAEEIGGRALSVGTVA